MKVMNLLWAKITLVALGMALSAGVTAGSVESDPNSQSFVAEKYLGKYDELEKNGYTTKSGIGNVIQRIPRPWARAICQRFDKVRIFDCVFVLTEIVESGAPGPAIHSTPFDMIHIKLPKGWSYFDSGDTECKATGYPNTDIVAIGQWAWRKKPLLGGYAHSLKKAWRIDYQSMRFVEISTHGVECGFNDDRD